MSAAVIAYAADMVRWEPGAKERLQAAALDLYVNQGFEQTTVEEIARRVGLTERTFFRHFADKREVLFDGQDRLRELFVAGLRAAPDDASPLEMVASALRGSADYFGRDRREWSRRRQQVIAANLALQERELLKLAALAAAVAETLRERGVGDPAATLAAESGVTVFGVAFTLWIRDGEERPFAEVERAVLAEWSAMSAGLGDLVAAGPTTDPESA